MIELILPVPVSSNVYWRKFNNRMVLSPKAKEYQKQVAKIVTIEKPKSFSKDDRLRFEVDFYPKDKRKRDLDNFCGKALQDSLQNCGLFVDDSQIDSVEYTRCEIDKNNPRVEVRIEKIIEFESTIEDDNVIERSEVFEFSEILQFTELLGKHILQITPIDPEYWQALDQGYCEDFPYEKTDLFVRLIMLLGDDVWDNKMNPDRIAIDQIDEFNQRISGRTKVN